VQKAWPHCEELKQVYKEYNFFAKAIKRLESMVSLPKAASDTPGHYTIQGCRCYLNRTI
jgi:hypothetical protein